MITNPTVFVLGAGASVDYGFPIGRQLVLNIVRSCDDFQLRSLVDPGDMDLHEGERAPDFAEALALSNQQSIDSFLSKNSEYREIGLRAIALNLLPCEKLNQFEMSAEKRFYEGLLQFLDPPTEKDFERNRASIVTFNYDRSLEQFLYQSWMNSFGLSHYETVQLMKNIEIIHVHGELGKHPAFDENGLQYGTVDVPNKTAFEVFPRDVLTRAVESLKLAYDSNIYRYGPMQRANFLLQHAKQVCFLGFGYGEENLCNLFQVPAPKEIGAAFSAAFFGSAMNVPQSDRYRTEVNFGGRIQLADPSSDCLEALGELELRLDELQ